MSPLAWPGFLAFFAVALVVGVRLVALAVRTRGLPELLLGIGVLGIGPLGFGLAVASVASAGSAPITGRCLAALATLAISAGVAAKAIFNWRLYRPDSRAAAAAALGTCGLLLAAAVGQGVGTGFDPDAWRRDAWNLLRQGLQVGSLFWGAAEAVAWWRRMRRRMALGLADPLVADRFLLWAIGAGAAGLGTAIGTATQLATGLTPLELPWLTLCSSLHGLVAAVALGLAFIPPAPYRRWVRSRAGVAAH